jgi:nucleotide-binding universal stress UspA family protein
MYRKILVPVDGSAAARHGLQQALNLAREGRAELLLLHVVDEFIPAMTPDAVYGTAEMIEAMREAGQAVLREAAEYAQAQGVTPRTDLVERMGGRAAPIIVDRATDWGADLIVIGTHGRRGVRRLVMGSDAEEVVRMSRIPVLLVKAQPD